MKQFGSEFISAKIHKIYDGINYGLKIGFDEVAHLFLVLPYTLYQKCNYNPIN